MGMGWDKVGMNGLWYDDLMSYVFPMEREVGVFDFKFGREI